MVYVRKDYRFRVRRRCRKRPSEWRKSPGALAKARVPEAAGLRAAARLLLRCRQWIGINLSQFTKFTSTDNRGWYNAPQIFVGAYQQVANTIFRVVPWGYNEKIGSYSLIREHHAFVFDHLLFVRNIRHIYHDRVLYTIHGRMYTDCAEHRGTRMPKHVLITDRCTKQTQ